MFYFDILENPTIQIPIDRRVGVTISFIVLQYFEQYPWGVILFTHDWSDGKEQGRKKLFDSWFHSMGANKLYKKDSEITLGRYSILASILLSNTHSLLPQIIDGFDQLVMGASNKPED